MNMRRAPGRASLSIGLTLAIIGVASLSARAGTLYSVEDVIRHQAFGFVRLTPDGEVLLFERRNGDPLQHSDLVAIDLQSRTKERLLFRRKSADGYWPLSVSMDNRHITYVHAHNGMPIAGGYDLRSHHDVEFKFSPNANSPPIWLSETEALFSYTQPEWAPTVFGEQIAARWKKKSVGRVATASRIGSGQYAAKWQQNAGEGIALGNVATGKLNFLGQGRFLDQPVLSSDATRLAAVRNIPAVLDPAPLIQALEQKGPLVIFDLLNRKNSAEICPTCAVSPQSLRWSPTAKHLAFAVYGENGLVGKPEIRIYDSDTGAVHPANLQGLDVVRPRVTVWEKSRLGDPQFAWVGDDLAVLARDKTHTANDDGALKSLAWFLTRPNQTPMNLTSAFGSQSLEVVGVLGDAILLLADGQIWSVGAEGQRRLISSNISGRFRVWHERTLPMELPTGRPESVLVLEGIPTASDAKTIYFLDVESGHVATIRAPARDAKIKAVSIAARRIAFEYSQGNANVLAIADANAPSRDVLRLNEYLNDRLESAPVAIAHKARNGDSLISWLWLPPGYHGEVPLPTVVQIYPGNTYGSKPPKSELDTRLLTSRGYAVLLASVPIDGDVLPRDPLLGLADTVLSAVDAAIASKYVDNERLAIMGWSFGGFGTVGVIAQTDRFKAAIAIAGIYDFQSHYGVQRISDRLAAEFDGLYFDLDAPIGNVETDQTGLGAPPWRDPERYRRNSPLMYVESVRTPVMLMHGDLDYTVSMTQSEELFTALYRLNKDATFVRYWGEGHDLPVSPANIRDYWARTFHWYDEHIGPPYPVQSMKENQ